MRIGRGELNRMTSFIRGPNTRTLTPLAPSNDKNTAIGAFLSGVICWIFATRACCSGVVAGIELVIRLQANGAMQLDRTLYRCMSSAIDFDNAVMPNLAAE